MNLKVFFSTVGIQVFLTIILSAGISNAQSIPMVTGEGVPYTSANLKNYGEFTELVTIVIKEMGKKPNYIFYPGEDVK